MVGDWRQVSVLIVGCGSIGKRHARVLEGMGVTDLRACDPLPAQRDALLVQTPTVRMYESYHAALLDKPDAVWVCTPPALHIPLSQQAIRAGCHVFTEKPLSDTSEGVEDLIALAAEQQRKVMVGLCFRYHEGLVKAKHYLNAGRIGRLVSVRAMVGEHLPDVRPDYRSLFSSGSGGAFDLMHDIDLALWYAGQSVRRVYSLNGCYSDIGIEAPDIVEILIQFDDRCLASVHLDFFQRPRRRQIELIGMGGVIIVEFARWDCCTISSYEASRGEWERQELITDRDDMFRAEDQDFLHAIAVDRPIACTIAEALKSVEVVLAAQTRF